MVSSKLETKVEYWNDSGNFSPLVNSAWTERNKLSDAPSNGQWGLNPTREKNK